MVIFDFVMKHILQNKISSADSRQQTADSRQQTADSRQQTALIRLPKLIKFILFYRNRIPVFSKLFKKVKANKKEKYSNPYINHWLLKEVFL